MSEKKGQDSMHANLIISPNAPNSQRVESSAQEFIKMVGFLVFFFFLNHIYIPYQETPTYLLWKICLTFLVKMNLVLQ